MKRYFARLGPALAAAALAGCTAGSSLPDVADGTPVPRPEAGAHNGLDGLIARYAAHYEVPVGLVHRVVKRESTYNPKAYNAGNWGLMQIRYPTAKTMGYRGEPEGLLDAETNLTYAVKYLRGAYMVANGNHDRAVRLYARGYYYDAKARDMLVATGLRPGEDDESTAATAVAKADPPPPVEKPDNALPGASMAFSGATPTDTPVPAFGATR